MPREREDYSGNLDLLLKKLGADTVTVSIDVAARVVGVDKRTLIADKTFPLKRAGRNYRVPVVGLARWLSG